MKQAQQNIYYCNFDADINKLKNQIPKTKIKALIMGGCGTGKTTFINKSCNTNHDSGIFPANVGSVTKGIAFQDIAQFPPGVFRIYDTPGSDSKVQALQHAMVLRAGLTTIPLNLILISVKFDKRWVKPMQQFCNQFKILKKYSSSVVMLISHYDQMKQKNRNSVLYAFQETRKLFKIKVPIVFYSNENSNIKTVVKLLYQIGIKNKPQKIEIDDEMFYKHFKIANSVNFDQIGDYINEFKQKFQILVKVLKSFKNISKFTQNIVDLKLYMKFELKRFQDEQYKKYSSEFNDDYMAQDLYLKISKISHYYMQEANAIADTLLIKSVYDDCCQKTT